MLVSDPDIIAALGHAPGSNSKSEELHDEIKTTTNIV
jgi:hypothetical protein